MGRGAGADERSDSFMPADDLPMPPDPSAHLRQNDSSQPIRVRQL